VGTFWGRANGHGAFAALMVGFVSGLLFFMANVVLSWTNIHFLYVAPILFVVSFLTIVGVSVMTTPPDQEAVQAYLWTRKFYDAETIELKELAWYQNYRILSIGLLVLTALTVGAFW
jgi:SSS family solute:Na+ symporter